MLGRAPRFVARGDRRHRQRHRLVDHDGGRADPESRSASRRGGRSASRSGAGRNRACSDRRPTSPQHFGTAERRNRSSRASTATSTSTAARDACAACRCSDRQPAADVLRQAVAPLADLGIVGAIASKSRRPGGTDSTSFNAAGLPGISSAQDPIEYQSYTWHTNLDNLRARDRRRCAEGGDRGGDDGVCAGDAGRAPSPLHDGRDAETGGACAAVPRSHPAHPRHLPHPAHPSTDEPNPRFAASPGSSATHGRGVTRI